MKRMKLAIIVGVGLLLTLACASIGSGDNNAASQDEAQDQEANGAAQNAIQEEKNTAPTENDTDADQGSDSPLWNTDFGNLLESGDLILEEINSIADGETNGRILTVQFTNPTTDEIIVSLPCGLVFIPTSTDEQELMMLQPLDLLLSPGESAPVTPYVVCVELSAPAPAVDSGYQIGYLASGQLLAFAECICDIPLNEELDSFDGVGVQFAAWTIAINGDFSSILEEGSAALGDEFAGMGESEILEAITGMLSSMGSEWLDRCGIVLEPPAE